MLNEDSWRKNTLTIKSLPAKLCSYTKGESPFSYFYKAFTKLEVFHMDISLVSDGHLRIIGISENKNFPVNTEYHNQTK